MSGDKIKQRTATAVSVAAVAVYTELENKLQIGICGDIFNIWFPCRRAGSAHRCRHWLHRGQLSSRERITQHGRNNRISGDADASKGCRIADPYRVNSHNHINRGRVISATTRFNICYPLHFCGRTNFASTVHILKLLAKSQFVNPPLS